MQVSHQATGREDAAALQTIAQAEGWLQSLPEVRRATDLKLWQRALFWALRLYILAMTAIVVWAFASGKVVG